MRFGSFSLRNNEENERCYKGVGMMDIVFEALVWIAYLLSLYFSIFLVLIYLDKKSFFAKEKSSLQPKEFPLVSIIVPAYNEEKTIIKTLESINGLDYPQEKLEVIVVNDGSQDQTKLKVEEYIKDKAHFQLLNQDNKGKAAAMNRALQLVQGEFFACLDADSFVDPLTLRKMLSFYYEQNNPKLAIITPAMKVFQPKNLLQKVQWIEYIVMILFGRISSHIDSLYVAPGPFSVYKTSIITALGSFDEKSITEDQEIAYRVQKNHYLIRQCFDGYVYTTAPRTWKRFYSQRRRWYMGSLHCLHQYRNMIANRKYGDFGLMQMVKNVTGYFLAITGMGTAFYLIFLPLLEKVQSLVLIRFKVQPFIAHFQMDFSMLSLLLNNFRQGFVVIFLFVLAFLFFYWAHRNAQEKMHSIGIVPLIPYFFFYYLLKGGILLFSLAQFAKSEKVKW